MSEISASISTISFFKFLNINFMGWVELYNGLQMWVEHKVDLVEGGGQNKKKFQILGRKRIILNVNLIYLVNTFLKRLMFSSSDGLVHNHCVILQISEKLRVEKQLRTLYTSRWISQVQIHLQISFGGVVEL